MYTSTCFFIIRRSYMNSVPGTALSLSLVCPHFFDPVQAILVFDFGTQVLPRSR